MLAYIINLLRRIFSISDIHEKINLMHRRSLFYFLIMICIELAGFALIAYLLEEGFHWKYLMQI